MNETRIATLREDLTIMPTRSTTGEWIDDNRGSSASYNKSLDSLRLRVIVANLQVLTLSESAATVRKATSALRALK